MRVERKKLVFFLLTIVVLSFFLFFLIGEEEKIVYPTYGRDTDGTLQDEIVRNNREGYETVLLKFFPYGYIEFYGWKNVSMVKKVFAFVEWRTEKDLGAGNIYIGYSFDGKNYVEVGPFNESENYRVTVLEIPANIFTDLENVKIRFRGEDLDFATDAYAEVKVYLKVISYKFG